MTNGSKDNTGDMGGDFEIVKTTRRAAGGTWVFGHVNGHSFDALVFAEHAENAEWEIGDSRISKLWLKRLADASTVYSWDRGLDIPAKSQTAQHIVDFLCAGLAEHVYGK